MISSLTHSLTNKKTMTMTTTMTKTILRLATFEALITILKIENLRSDYDSNFDLTIKSDTGQHLPFLQCSSK